MGRTQTFEEFLKSTTPDIPLWSFLMNLLVAAILCYLLGLIYVRFGRSLSSRKSLASNFVVLGMTTMLIISIVKASLALSLGLVGALSIVRFRTAIKEPEELAYVFVTIALGLGLGAGQTLITVLGFVGIIAVICGRAWFVRNRDESNLYLIIGSEGSKRLSIESLTSVLRQNCQGLELKRYDESNGRLEASYLVRFNSYAQLEQAMAALQQHDGSISVSFIESSAGR